MERYDSYKDSGVKWLGEIPSHWDSASLLYLLRAKISDGPHETPNLIEDGIPFISIDSLNETKEIDFSVVKKFISYKDYERYCYKTKLEKGDVLFSKAATIGKTAIVGDGVFMVWSPLAILKPNLDKISSLYLYYIMNCKKAIDEVSLSGSKNTQINVGMRELEKIRIPIPSIEEQSKITYFLEKETSKIDEAIAQQQKMIDLLNERKQIIINNAVTKGLDPNVKMKPSGIDWIGDIPEHWEARKLGSIGSTINGVSHDSAYFGEGYPFVSYSDVYKNVSLPKTVLGLAKSSNQERLLFSVEKGDVFFTRTSETAEEIAFSSTCLETIENAVFAGFLIRFRPKQGLIEPSFSKYYFRAYIHRSYFVKEMNLVIRASLSQQLLKGLPILLPSLKEQREIADYLDNQIIGIDSCISNINKQISLLQERKQIIINDVVTGKVKVV